MIEVRKRIITNGTNFPARTICRFKPLASFYAIPEFYFPNVREYLGTREGIKDKTFVNLRFLDINSEIDERFLVGDPTGEFDVEISIDFATIGALIGELNVAGQEIPKFKKDMRLYDILLKKNSVRGDIIEGLELKPLESGSYYDSDESYLNNRYPIQL